MIFETTQDYAVIVPLMISNLISFFISFRMQREPIYESLAIQDGIHLPSEATRLREGQRLVVQAMRPAVTAMRSDMTVREAFDRAPTTEFNSWPVTEDRGVVGVISLDRLEEALAKGEEAKRLIELIDVAYFPHVHADQPLHLALERMGAAKLDVLPVVSRENIHHMIGVIALPSILDSYGLGRQ
jgi:chloride channel protein, CIC family